MTTQKQNEANRRNALLSTGPRTDEGKQRSRQNAVRHGLTAETVISGVEDAARYAEFEAEILNEYAPESIVERELTLRLASLFWRLRRASLIETGLLQIHCKLSSSRGEQDLPGKSRTHPFHNIRLLSLNPSCGDKLTQNGGDQDQIKTNQKIGRKAGIGNQDDSTKKWITRAFLQLAELGSAPFERVGRYEAALWRQFVQTLIALDEAKRHRLVASRHRFKPYPPQW
jgi:hypothetical protein